MVQWSGPFSALAECGETRRLDLTLTRFGQAGIEVVHRDGRACADRPVILQFEEPSVPPRTVTSDDSGRGSAQRLPAGRWTARSGDATPILFDVRPGAESSVRIVVD